MRKRKYYEIFIYVYTEKLHLHVNGVQQSQQNTGVYGNKTEF